MTTQRSEKLSRLLLSLVVPSRKMRGWKRPSMERIRLHHQMRNKKLRKNEKTSLSKTLALGILWLCCLASLFAAKFSSPLVRNPHYSLSVDQTQVACPLYPVREEPPPHSLDSRRKAPLLCPALDPTPLQAVIKCSIFKTKIGSVKQNHIQTLIKVARIMNGHTSEIPPFLLVSQTLSSLLLHLSWALLLRMFH